MLWIAIGMSGRPIPSRGSRGEVGSWLLSWGRSGTIGIVRLGDIQGSRSPNGRYRLLRTVRGCWRDGHGVHGRLLVVAGDYGGRVGGHLLEGGGLGSCSSEAGGGGV